MNILKVDLENCYGINKLTHEFNFDKRKTQVIYAPNGSMKTSFSKTLKAISVGKEPKDEIFPERETKYSFLQNDEPIKAEEILVVESYSSTYSSKERMATLLVNETLKEKYQTIVDSIDNKKKEIFKDIKRISGSSNAEIEVINTFGKQTIFENLVLINEQIGNIEYKEKNYKYGDIINPKVQDFLKKNSALLEDYLTKYTELIESSTFFKKGIFGTDNALGINKALVDNNFFEAKHTVVLEDETKIDDNNGLKKIIDKEKERIITDEDLVKKFDKIDNAITKNAQLKTFKKILEKEPNLLLELNDYEKFKQSLWLNYFASIKETLNSIILEYKESQEKIKEIVDRANSEKTDWEEVIKLFNNRFEVPFKLEVLNQDDVILQNSVSPNIGFKYIDGREEKSIEESKIIMSLSQGEKRALYLLNIIFEIQARKKEGNRCLLVLDDIADSFDYKNKYAIIEYLKDITDTPIFNVIILTHNFDFYRTVASRIPQIGYNGSFMTIKSDDQIIITKGQYIKNVFESWIKVINTNKKIFIASIPFARNLIEYIRGKDDADYNKLTSLLHIKPETEDINTSELVEIYNRIWAEKSFSEIPDNLIFNLINNEAENIIENPTDGIQLENKIVLSIAIRLLAEKYMINEINSVEEVEAITTNQTTGLFKLFKAKCSDKETELKLMEQVNLMTAENIHINAFMYEPILDLSDKYLIDLYQKIKALI